jgi:hypothetical protein
VLGTTGLAAAAVVAVGLGLARGALDGRDPRHAALTKLATVVVALQAIHFGEELATGFHRRFPEQLGLVPWSSTFFVTFNLFWLAVWGLSLLGVATGLRVWSFPLWFLAIAGMANGITHPALAIRAGGYFPGLVTSPFLGAAALLLWRRLMRATETATDPLQTAVRSSPP